MITLILVIPIIGSIILLFQSQFQYNLFKNKEFSSFTSISAKGFLSTLAPLRTEAPSSFPFTIKGVGERISQSTGRNNENERNSFNYFFN